MAWWDPTTWFDENTGDIAKVEDDGTLTPVGNIDDLPEDTEIPAPTGVSQQAINESAPSERFSIKSSTGDSDLISDEEFGALVQRSQSYPGFVGQRQNVAGMKKMLEEYVKNSPVQTDLSPLAALVDAQTGSNLAKSYKAPTSMDDKTAAIAKLSDYIQKAESGLSGDEVDLLKSQLNALYGRKSDELSAAVQRDKNKATKDKSEFYKSLDRDFGKKWSDYNAFGGIAAVDASLQSIDEAIANLRAKPDLVGTKGVRATPRSILAKVHPETAELKQKVAKGILGGFKAVFGGNPTEGERQAYYETAIDENLPAEANIRKLESLKKEYQRRAQEMEKSSAYAASQGTLEGYQGAKLNGPAQTEDGESAMQKKLRMERERRNAAKTAGGSK